MRILVACEFSGVVREAFRRRGHDAWSCDLLPAEDGSRYHYQGDVSEIIKEDIDPSGGVWSYWWDLMIAHPPCQYLSSSGLHWNKRVEGRQEKTDIALDFVRILLDAPIEKIALENPVGCISTNIRPPDQYIQPWQFGENASKKTGLWLKNLPLLVPTRMVQPNENGYYANQTPSGQNKLGPSPERAKERARTYQGIADAMAEQWG